MFDKMIFTLGQADELTKIVKRLGHIKYINQYRTDLPEHIKKLEESTVHISKLLRENQKLLDTVKL